MAKRIVKQRSSTRKEVGVNEGLKPNVAEERDQLVVTKRGRAAAGRASDLIYYLGRRAGQWPKEGKPYPPLGTRYKDQGPREVLHVPR